MRAASLRNRAARSAAVACIDRQAFANRLVIFCAFALLPTAASELSSGGETFDSAGLLLGIVDAATGARNLVATAESASAGQGVYQSIVQQFTREGNWRRRSLQNQRETLCKFLRHWLARPSPEWITDASCYLFALQNNRKPSMIRHSSIFQRAHAEPG
jgi:hypothetical protein